MNSPRAGFFRMPEDRDLGGHFATIIWNNDPGGLAEGFFEAALAVARAADRHEINRNTAASPVLFLARHWLELILKAILARGKEYGHLAQGYEFNHELLPLWGQVRGYVQGRWPDVPLPRASWDEVEATVAELNRIDPRGIAFRFADERAALPQEWLRGLVPSGIDLLVVIEQLDALHASLIGIDDGLSEEHAQEAEGRAAFYEATESGDG